jgi:hypothetical protein
MSSPGRPVYLIFRLEDKLILDMFNAIKHRLKMLILTRADHPQAFEPESIQKLADQVGLKSKLSHNCQICIFPRTGFIRKRW